MKLIFLCKTGLDISCNINTVHVSENVQNKMYSLHIRFKQSTDQIKK